MLIKKIQKEQINFSNPKIKQLPHALGQTHLVIKKTILSIKSKIVTLLITYYSLLLTSYLAYTLNLDAFALPHAPGNFRGY